MTASMSRAMSRLSSSVARAMTTSGLIIMSSIHAYSEKKVMTTYTQISKMNGVKNNKE